MNGLTPEEQAKKILDTITRQRFADWYNNGHFNTWICDETEGGVSKEQIIQDIIQLFRL